MWRWRRRVDLIGVRAAETLHRYLNKTAGCTNKTLPQLLPPDAGCEAARAQKRVRLCCSHIAD